MNATVPNALHHVVDQSIHAEGLIRASLILPPGYIGFEGHFPDEPVLPAIYHGLIATQIVENHLGRSLRLQQLSHAKFLQPIRPDTPFSLKCKWEECTGQIRISASLNDASGAAVSKFRLILH